MPTPILTEFPATSVKAIRAKNRTALRIQTDQRRAFAIQNVFERLEALNAIAVFRAIEEHSALSIEDLRKRAAQIVDAVNFYMRGGSEDQSKAAQSLAAEAGRIAEPTS